MNVRPPRLLARRTNDNPLQALEHEVAEEKVATLSRLGRRLEGALARLAACEAEAGADASGDREALLAEAGEALWYFVIQREAMGLRNTEQALRAYEVPRAVRLRMGVAPAAASARRAARQRQ